MKISEIHLAPSMYPSKKEQQELVGKRVLALLDNVIQLLNKVPIDGIEREVEAIHSKILNLYYPVKPKVLASMPGEQKPNPREFEINKAPILNQEYGFPYEKPIEWGARRQSR